jgi:hypothetical protein
MRLTDSDQTKHTRYCPWCGDVVYVLGWGILILDTMMGAKAAHCHADTGLPPNNYVMEGFLDLVQFYVG